MRPIRTHVTRARPAPRLSSRRLSSTNAPTLISSCGQQSLGASSLLEAVMNRASDSLGHVCLTFTVGGWLLVATNAYGGPDEAKPEVVGHTGGSLFVERPVSLPARTGVVQRSVTF